MAAAIEPGCQCTTDGHSAGKYVIYGSSSTVFTGCGAFTDYIYSGRTGGYPFMWCYVSDPSSCNVTETSTKNTLNEWKGAAWKRCSGHRCAALAKTNAIGVQLGSLTLANEHEWSDCCRECDDLPSCQGWFFVAGPQNCTLFSQIDRFFVGEAPEGFISGWPGYLDPPIECSPRDLYDLCPNYIRSTTIGSCIFSGLWVSIMTMRLVIFFSRLGTTRTSAQWDRETISTDSETRSSSSKSGTTYYTVFILKGTLKFLAGDVPAESAIVEEFESRGDLNCMVNDDVVVYYSGRDHGGGLLFRSKFTVALLWINVLLVLTAVGAIIFLAYDAHLLMNVAIARTLGQPTFPLFELTVELGKLPLAAAWVIGSCTALSLYPCL